MKKYYILWIVCMPILAILVSCSSSNEPSKISMSDYFPTTVGSWWINENWSIDSNGTRINLDSRDSLIIAGTIMVQGENVPLKLRYNLTSGGGQDTSIYDYVEGNKLCTLKPSFFAGIDSAKWIIFADCDSSSWTVLNDSNSIDTSGYATTKMIGTKGTQKNFIINGKTVQAQQFLINVKLKSVKVVSGEQNCCDSEIQMEVWLGKGVGIVQMICKVTKNVGMNVKGSESMLIDYNIK